MNDQRRRANKRAHNTPGMELDVVVLAEVRGGNTRLMNNLENVSYGPTAARTAGLRGLVLLVLLALLGVAFYDGLARLGVLGPDLQLTSFIVPMASFLLIVRQRKQLRGLLLESSWFGVVVTAVGLVAGTFGELSALYAIVQYGFVFSLWGLLLAFGGWPLVRLIWPALVLLLLWVPLPNFFVSSFIAPLQLITVELAAAMLRMVGASVVVQANVIELADFRATAAEVAGALQHALTVLAAAFLIANFVRAGGWQRCLLVVGAVPLLIVVTVLHVTVLGLVAEHGSLASAENFAARSGHWLVLAASVLLLAGVGWWLDRWSTKKWLTKAGRGNGNIGANRTSLLPRSVLAALPASVYGAACVLAIGTVFTQMLERRADYRPERLSFEQFPLHLASWSGTRTRLAQQHLNDLRLDDYIQANFRNTQGERVDFYSAYYATQRKGRSVHSPRSCLPGDGWVIRSLGRHRVEGVRIAEQPLYVNRTVIERAGDRQLVYYWFQQRGRLLTNEYLVKWYLFWDALTLNRSDGALVRLATPISEGEDIARGDVRLAALIAEASSELVAHIPGQIGN